MKKIGIKLLVLSAVLMVVISSCRREEPTIATIYVKNAADTFVPGAEVRLFGVETADQGGEVAHGEIRIDTIGTTNGAGQVTFDLSEFYELGQSGLFVLDIEVSKEALWGEGIIKVEEEVENQETITIN